ncbi:baseplate hub subunit and tail lysozyme [Vibrio phage vB_VmeM-32]|nr:baseplate hub subunit and tail lysozyme [Vibrio phage vB_VmeM-32]
MFNQQRFYGIVEDINDPLELGRVRVRVFFYHTAQKSKNDMIGIPSDELLWFHVAGSVDGCISGIGKTPLGLKCGTTVYGEFRDDFLQDGIVMGTLQGFTREMPDFNNGFTDPNKKFPLKTGSDINVLARTKNIESDELYSGKKLEIHNNDMNVYNIANVSRSSEIEVPTLKQMLTVDCGYNNRAVFRDDHFLIGIGHRIETTNALEVKEYLESKLESENDSVIQLTIDDSLIDKLFSEDLKIAKSKVTYSGNNARVDALTILEFHGYATSPLTNLLLADKYRDVYETIPNESLFNRARVMLLTGDYVSYAGNINVPKSKSDTVYPNNSVIETEHGFVIELDDTPNAQRYRFKHPSNSFYEYSVDGSKTEMLVGSDYQIVKRDKNIDIHGDFNITINGNSNVFIMGNVVQTIMGDVNEIIHGDSVQTVNGDVKQEIHGDLNTQNIDGDILEQVVNGNAIQKITGNNTQLIEGDNYQIIDGNNEQTINGNNQQTIVGTNHVTIEKTDTLIVNDSQNVTVNGNVTQSVDGNVNQTVKGNVTQIVDGSIDANTAGAYNIVAQSFSVKSNSTVNIEASSAAQMSGATTLIEASGTAQVSGATILLN